MMERVIFLDITRTAESIMGVAPLRLVTAIDEGDWR
jgi:hypothetical protein